MRYVLHQELVNGAWRWLIVNDKDRVIGRSALAYTEEGWARRDLYRTMKAMEKFGPSSIVRAPAVQLSLFPDMTVPK